MKQSDRYEEIYGNEINEFKSLIKKTKCTRLDEMPVTGETCKMLLWIRNLSQAELERLAMDAFNLSCGPVFSFACSLIFEKI